MTDRNDSSQPLDGVDDFSTREPLARMVRNSAFNIVGTALMVPFNVVALFVLARRLGTESLGTFFTIFAISAVVHWIADMGTTTVLTRRVARMPHDLHSIVAEAAGLLLFVCGISATVFVSMAAGWMAIQEEGIAWSVLVVAVVAMASRHALDFAANIFRGLERFEFENLARVVQTGLFCLFVWFGVYAETGGMIAAFVAYAASNLIAALLIWGVLFGKWRCAGWRLDRAMLSDWLRESVPLGVGDSIRQFLLQLDTLMLAAFRPAAVVGLFSIASRPLQPLQIVPRIIVSVTFPMMSRSAHTDRTRFSQAFAHTTNLLWVASLPICVLVSAFAVPLIVKTAGPEFRQAAGPLSFLIWATFLVFVNAQMRFVLTALDAEQKYWRLITRALIAKFVMNLVLIPIAGLYGACLGNLLGEFVLSVWGLRELRKMDVHGPSWFQLGRALPAAIAMAMVLIPFSNDPSSLPRLAAIGAASMVLYVAGCLLCGAVPWSDVVRVWQVVRRPVISAQGGVGSAPSQVAKRA